MNALKCQLIVKVASKIKTLKLFEETAIEIVDGCPVLGFLIGKEKAYSNFNVTIAGKYSLLLKKIGAGSENIHTERLRMPHKKLATKIKFCVPDNAQLGEYLQRPRSQFPNARPTVVLWLSGVSIRTAIVFASDPRGQTQHKGAIDYETEYAASLTACGPLEYDNRANARLAQERITNDQREPHTSILFDCVRRILMENLQTEQRHVIEMTSAKEASNWLSSTA